MLRVMTMLDVIHVDGQASYTAQYERKRVEQDGLKSVSKVIIAVPKNCDIKRTYIGIASLP